ncbi:MAG TPA: ABC transporter ATP-binding protein [Bacilli bacterium]
MEIIRTEGLTKKFGDFTANDNINLSIESGEIRAIVGENGAGKTTLMNMLYGLLKPTSGDIYIKGKKVELDTPANAISHGIGMVHQHFKLVPSLTVYENVLLGIEIYKKIKIKNREYNLPLIDKAEEKKRVQEIIDRYHFNLQADAKLKDLSIGEQQKVEIIKMLYRDVDILILDEPTAVLTPQETDALFDTIRKMKSRGATIIIITHKLQEVMAISDSVTVIKSGKVVGSMKTSETSEVILAQMMVGRDVLLKVDKKYKDFKSSPVVYEVKNLFAKTDDGREILKNISFQIREGEILGIAGVEGNGQSELIKVLTGLMESSSGQVILKDEEITNKWPKDLRKKGIAIIPSDRYVHGLCLDMKIQDNMIAGYHDSEDVCKYGLMKTKNIEKKRDELIEQFDIRLSDRTGKISSLSGGNAQKIIIAREFTSNPQVLIASQPTRGVDIGAIEFIHKSILEFAEKKKAILLVSSDLSEVMNLSDRILVMYKGEIIGEVDAKGAKREDIGLLMAGIKPKGEGKYENI